MTDQFVKDSLALSPVNASQAGYHKHIDPKTGKTIDLDAQLDDVRPARHGRAGEVLSRVAPALPDRDAHRVAEPAGRRRLPPHRRPDRASTCSSSKQIQNYKHNPTVYVELLGNGLFLPLTQEYASKEVRVGDVISRIGQIPRFLDQAKSQLTDADPIFISTAIDENEGNLNLVDSVAAEIPAGSPLKAQYDNVGTRRQEGAQRLQCLDEERSGQAPTNGRTWRLGAEWYAPKFHYVMETSIQPDAVAGRRRSGSEEDARRDAADSRCRSTSRCIPARTTTPACPPQERENKIIARC